MKKISSIAIKYPFAITALVCLVFYLLPFKPKPFGDGEYHEGTIQLIQFVRDGFQGNVRVDKGLFTLFYFFIPYALVFYFKSKAAFFAAGIIFNALVTCIAIKYLFRAFDAMRFSDNSKFIVLVLLNLFPIHVYYAFGITAEAASFCAICLFVFLWSRMAISKDYSAKNFILLALLVTAFIGMRPNMIPFGAALLIFVLLMKISISSKFAFATVMLTALFLLVAAENVLNNSDGDFKKKVFRYQLVWSRFELRDEPLNWLPQHGQDAFASSDYLNNLKKRQELDSICEVNNYDKTTYFVNWVKDDIIQNPGMTIRQYFLKFFQAQSFIISPLMKSDKSTFVKYAVHIYINLINYVLVFLSLLGIYKAMKEKQFTLFIPLLLLWAWSLVYIFLFHSEQRYMFAVRPVVVFLAIFFIDGLSRKATSKKKYENSTQ